MNSHLSCATLTVLAVVACSPAEQANRCPKDASDVAVAANSNDAPQPAPSAADTSAAAPVSAPAVQVLATVTVQNPSSEQRLNESVALEGSALGSLDLAQVHVLDEAGQSVLMQVLDVQSSHVQQVLFQVTLAPSQTQTFRVVAGAQPPVAADRYQVYGRFVRERFDDFVWENDQFASRVYGPALEIAGKEALTSSGVDAWVKRVPRLLVNEWYLTGDYHADHGEGGDFYSVGKTRGCGGTGIWDKDQLYVSKNFTTSRVLASGPLRLVFELSYAAWPVGKAGSVTETKRITLDAHSRFNRIETQFGKSKKPLTAALGIAKHTGSTADYDLTQGWLRTWEPLGSNGNLGCAVVVPGAASLAQAAIETDYLLTAPVNADGTLTYYTGIAWDGNGKISDAKAWDAELKATVDRVKTPLVVVVSGVAPATPASPASP